ncbi:MAG TPA: S8 family serine peptidase [Thermoanaerobaculia bacterium]|jgi:subtilisin family serine protease
MLGSTLLGLSLVLAAPAFAADPQPTSNYLIQINGTGSGLASQVSAAGGTLLWAHPDLGYAAATSNDPGFAAKLKQAGVPQVDQDLELQWVPSAQDVGLQQVGASAANQAAAAPAGSFFYPCQWSLPKIDAPAAWAKGDLGSGIKVAVIDTGVDPFHADLVGKVDTANSTSVLTPGSSACGSFDESTIYDLDFHGSFVSGLITTNNRGTTGVAPGAQIVMVKALNCQGFGRFSDIIAGIYYAANLADVQVINMSLGAGFAKNLKGAGPLVAAFNKAVNYASSQGKLVVSAAGNSGVDMDKDGNVAWVPAESGNGIAIYATDNHDGLASYSNHGVSGTWVGAPGGDFPNTAAPLPGCVFPAASQGLIVSVCSSFVCGGNNFYVAGDGTSFSSPIVAGVAALVDGKHAGTLAPSQLKTILSQSAVDLGKTGTDNLFSHGRVNAGAAVDH